MVDPYGDMHQDENKKGTGRLENSIDKSSASLLELGRWAFSYKIYVCRHILHHKQRIEKTNSCRHM